ncbi:MAG: ABC transporter ATP-binding protein [Actinobacteria bacterium]|nr:ABC transporter ATP-binding protein [Actinomycetota bacterium]MCI0544096.1 ABC transporter ATP-binding protein [Actinomycetota bacterium]
MISEGEWVSIVGPSGAGKSTLLNLIGLLDSPSSGSYLLEGVDVATLGHNRRAELRSEMFGFVFQAFHLVGSRTVVENVELGLVYAGVSRRDRRARAVEATASVGLAERVDARTPTLSGGEKQRVALARALATNARVLLCDEPTGNLDSETGAKVLAQVSKAHHRGMTVIMITHNHEVARLGDRIVHMRSGRIVEGGGS